MLPKVRSRSLRCWRRWRRPAFATTLHSIMLPLDHHHLTGSGQEDSLPGHDPQPPGARARLQLDPGERSLSCACVWVGAMCDRLRCHPGEQQRGRRRPSAWRPLRQRAAGVAACPAAPSPTAPSPVAPLPPTHPRAGPGCCCLLRPAAGPRPLHPVVHVRRGAAQAGAAPEGAQAAGRRRERYVPHDVAVMSDSVICDSGSEMAKLQAWGAVCCGMG